MVTYAVLGAVVVMMVSFVGVVFAFGAARTWFEKNVAFLVSFAAGVFFVTAGGLALEVLEIANEWYIGVGFIVIGYILASLVHYILPETHHHHGEECNHSHGRGAKRLIIGDAIHNIADGVVIVVAFMASPVLGLGVWASIVIHEALQEVSEFFVLRRAGYSVKKALFINFAVSSTILIGVGLGYFAVVSHDLEVLLLALSAGFFFHVVVHDLLPHRRNHATRSEFGRHVLIVLVGVVLMASVQAMLGDSHDHGHEYFHDGEHHDDYNHDHYEDNHNDNHDE
jgi:zinc transporter ZupT